MAVLNIKCPKCGVEVHVEEGAATGTCSKCRTKLQVETELSKEIQTLEAELPNLGIFDGHKKREIKSRVDFLNNKIIMIRIKSAEHSLEEEEKKLNDLMTAQKARMQELEQKLASLPLTAPARKGVKFEIETTKQQYKWQLEQQEARVASAKAMLKSYRKDLK